MTCFKFTDSDPLYVQGRFFILVLYQCYLFFHTGPLSHIEVHSLSTLKLENIEIYSCVCRRECEVAKARSRQWNMYNGYISVVDTNSLKQKQKFGIHTKAEKAAHPASVFRTAPLIVPSLYSQVRKGRQGRVTHVGEALHSVLRAGL